MAFKFNPLVRKNSIGLTNISWLVNLGLVNRNQSVIKKTCIIAHCRRLVCLPAQQAGCPGLPTIYWSLIPCHWSSCLLLRSVYHHSDLREWYHTLISPYARMAIDQIYQPLVSVTTWFYNHSYNHGTILVFTSTHYLSFFQYLIWF